MMKRQWLHGVLAGAGLIALTAASAQAQVVQVGRGDSRQSISFNFGGFFPTAEDRRIPDDAPDFLDDVLVANREVLAFDIDDFKNVTFGAEYLFGIGDFLEGGVGASYYQKKVPSIYRDVTYPGGSEIEQDLKLRIVPITATIRFLPLGRGAAVEPYVGGGVGINVFRYSEIGDFVDFRDNSIFAARFVKSGTAVGPVLLGGVRIPVGDAVSVGGELRWQKASGDLGDDDFLATKINLGGTTANFTIQFRF
jgi:opacity protein-like surface antigen